MLAQTCPMTTLTVVNVDAADRPEGAQRARWPPPGKIVQNRETTMAVPAALEAGKPPDQPHGRFSRQVSRFTVGRKLAADLGACVPTGDPKGRSGGPPGRLLERKVNGRTGGFSTDS